MTARAIDLLVGWLPDDAGRDALALAARLASTAGSGLTVRACTVLPRTWQFPSMAKVDAEYSSWLTDQGDSAVEAAREAMSLVLPPGTVGRPDAFFVDDSAESAGLSAAAATHAADIVVLGSTDGPDGAFAAGSTTDTLLHSSSVPLALAPNGTRHSTAPFRSIVCAYSGTPESRNALTTTAALASDWGTDLRLVAFAPRRATTFPPVGGYDAEDAVTAEWSEQASALLDSACTEVAATYPDVALSHRVGVGGDWKQVVESVGLGDGDLLVVGSSRVGPLARVFIGSTASKILRHSPVPVIVVPRGTALGHPPDHRATRDLPD